MSIGAVLDLLRPDFPDVTISKIRFLEAEGLVTPERTASGYRRFTAYDCARLRFILTAQRDQYLPLKVIKAQLDAQPDGELPADRIRLRRTAFGAGLGRRLPRRRGTAGVAPTQVRLRREDLLTRSGVDDDLLQRAGQGRRDHARGPADFFDEHSVVIAQCARALAELRCRAAASAGVPLRSRPPVRPDRPDRGPVVKAGKAGARDRADDLAREVAALAITLHTSLIKSAVRDVLDR